MSAPACADELATLSQRLGAGLAAAGWVLTTAESCTGGWLAKCVTDCPGSSAWFDRGFVTYSNAAKQALLGVSAATLAVHGAVSEPVVREMAAGAGARAGADVAVAVSGIAGPGGGSADKPVGLVCFGFLVAGHAQTVTHRFAGDRDAVRRQAVTFALQRLLALLAGPA